MTLGEAFALLGANGTRQQREQAVAVVLEHAKRVAGRLRAPQHERDDAAAEVVTRILKGWGGGGRRMTGSPEGYLATAVRNVWLNEKRKTRREELQHEEPGTNDSLEAPSAFAIQSHADQEEDRERDATGMQRLAQGRTLVGAVADQVINRTLERHRDGLRATWREMRAYYYDHAALDDLIKQAGEVPNKKTRNNRQKAFERFRDKLLDLAAEEPSQEKLETIRGVINALLINRCQLSGQRGSGVDRS